MRVLNQIEVPQESDSKFPFGTIRNEDDTVEGTPVIEEIYGDILTNIYKILQLVGVVPTGTQDSDASQYQIIEAIQKLPNVINDVEHTLLLSTTVWSVPLKFQFLPNKFVFFAKASENFDPSINYTIKGNDTAVNISYPVVCPSGFEANDGLMVVLDNSTAKIFPISNNTVDKIIPISLGSPLPYNNSKTIYYFENGKLYSETPTVKLIEEALQMSISDSTILILQAFILKGKLLCFTTNSVENYRFYQFSLDDFDNPTLVNYEIPDSINYNPYCFTDGQYVYLTNNGNITSDDFMLKKINYDEVNAVMSDNSNITLESSFVKTTNAVIKNNSIITLISGELIAYSLTSSTKTILGLYDNAIGNLFYFKNSIYFGSSDTASRWIL